MPLLAAERRSLQTASTATQRQGLGLRYSSKRSRKREARRWLASSRNTKPSISNPKITLTLRIRSRLPAATPTSLAEGSRRTRRIRPRTPVIPSRRRRGVRERANRPDAGADGLRGALPVSPEKMKPSNWIEGFCSSGGPRSSLGKRQTRLPPPQSARLIQVNESGDCPSFAAPAGRIRDRYRRDSRWIWDADPLTWVNVRGECPGILSWMSEAERLKRSCRCPRS